MSLPWSRHELQMPMYKGLKAREGHSLSLPSVKYPVHKGLKPVTGGREGKIKMPV